MKIKKIDEDEEKKQGQLENIIENKRIFNWWIDRQYWTDKDKEVSSIEDMKAFVTCRFSDACVQVNITEGNYPGICFVVEATNESYIFKQDLILARNKMLEYKRNGKINW